MFIKLNKANTSLEDLKKGKDYPVILNTSLIVAITAGEATVTAAAAAVIGGSTTTRLLKYCRLDTAGGTYYIWEEDAARLLQAMGVTL